ncbi:MAG TPA: hypothetical protein VHZ73_00375 [Vicinamibacterales bacterium]|jgi:hypothetical protein|nr:hypothetical protein [Vicinamibacterales bacterium]
MIRNEILAIGLLIALAVGLLAHAFFPRYDWRTIDHNGSVSVVVYDRWSGRFQRAVYGDNGSLNVMGVFTPF